MDHKTWQRVNEGVRPFTQEQAERIMQEIINYGGIANIQPGGAVYGVVYCLRRRDGEQQDVIFTVSQTDAGVQIRASLDNMQFQTGVQADNVTGQDIIQTLWSQQQAWRLRAWPNSPEFHLLPLEN